MTQATLDHAKISEAAYLIWIDEGRPEGCDEDHWLRAIDALTKAQPKAKAARKAPAKRAAAKTDAKSAAKSKADKPKAAAKKPRAPKATTKPTGA